MLKRTRGLGLTLALVVSATLAGQGKAAAATPPLGMVCTPGTVAGTTHTFNLVANTGHVSTPDGNSVFMWSYANADAPDNSHFQEPGPVLCVTQGETVVVNLSNTLAEAVSVVFPAQDAQVTATGGVAGLLTTEAAALGGTVSYSFTAGAPGTYIYQSGSNVSLQVEMGLYGALIVRPTIGANFAYDASTRFDPKREYLQLLSAFDPDLHHAVEVGTTYDFNKLVNRYFAINGRSFPDSIQDNGSGLLPNQPYGGLVRIQPTTGGNPYPALVRLVNVSPLNHPFHPHGNHLTEIAQDGRMLLSPSGASASTERFGETVGAGQTQDYLLPWYDQDNWNPNGTAAQQLPPQPNYRNLSFKDANTFYSGNPYLGYKGTLPTGTTVQNVCGEWYFPFHSHALNEFSNYDAGFGGMGTLLRVDPPGGCFAAPTTTKTLLGTTNSGTYANLALDDAKYYKLNSTTTGTRTTDWYGQFSAVPAGATNLTVTYKGNNSVTANQKVYIWNWAGTGSWVQLGAAAGTSVGPLDASVTATSPATYVGAGANYGLVRIRVLTTGGATNFVTGANLMKLVYDAP
jgi:FtsP/CotA-like multicopper oxidase with cupredoxin domain